MLFLTLLLLQTARYVTSQPETPQNVTITFVDARTVQVRWSSGRRVPVEKFDVTYKPIEAKVVTVVAGNSASVTLHNLEPDTQYQVTVTAVQGGSKGRSRPVVFRTMAVLTESPPLSALDGAPPSHSTPSMDDLNSDPTGSRFTPNTSVTVRGVEISLVLLALVVWIFAITLFFHRWGKIRMLLPYQPDYKTQQSLKVPGTGSSIGPGDGSGHHEATGCVQHLRWSSRYLDEPLRPASRWSSRHRLSCAAFSGYVRTSTECESPERLRHSRSHNSLHRLSIPVPHLPRQRGSIHSLLDCLRNQQELPETQPLFVVPDVTVQETQLNGSPPPTRPRPMRNSIKKQKTAEEGTKSKLLRPAEMKRKAFLRKISLQETHLNYNQDYWLEYEKSTRFHTSLDLGYFNGEASSADAPADTTTEKQGPIINLEPTQAIDQNRTRQSELPLNNRKKLFTRGYSEPFIVRKKCSCNSCGHGKAKSNSEEARLLEASPSSENLPLFMERVGQIETDFEGLDDRSESAFSDVTLNGCTTSRSATFDFEGGDAFFGQARGSSSSESEIVTTSPQNHIHIKPQRPFSIPIVSVIRPSNSPSPLESDDVTCK